jgi:tetratricopeptide (TPR) repeat protein
VRRGDYARARAFAEESLMLYTPTGDRWSKAAPLFDLGRIAYRQGEYVTARQLYEECLALWREVGDTNGCALATNALGEIARVMGDYAQAAAYYNESITLTPMGGDIGLTFKRDGIATKNANLGFAVLHHEDDAQALALFRESLPIAQESDDQYDMAICLIGVAGVALARQEDVRAARLLAASIALLESSRMQLEPVDGIELDSEITKLHAQLDDATFAKAWEEGRSLTLEQAIASANQD